MSPYLRDRRFRGWDWCTPRPIRHLPWREQERLIQEVGEAVRRHRRYWLFGRWLPLLSILAILLAAIVPFLNASLLISLLLYLAFQVQMGAAIVWYHRRSRQELRQKLLDAGHRPAICFECGYDLEGFEGNDCPACDVPLLRQAESPAEKS